MPGIPCSCSQWLVRACGLPAFPHSNKLCLVQKTIDLETIILILLIPVFMRCRISRKQGWFYRHMKTKKIVIYLRVSTGNQNTTSQDKVIKEYCERRGWKHVQAYEDKINGAKHTRPAKWPSNAAGGCPGDSSSTPIKASSMPPGGSATNCKNITACKA